MSVQGEKCERRQGGWRFVVWQLGCQPRERLLIVIQRRPVSDLTTHFP